jgi:hypothetical protein
MIDMGAKFAICVVGFSIFLSTARAQDNKPTPPRPPKGTVTQSISKTTYVKPDQLEKGTSIVGRTVPPGLTFVCHLYGAADQGGPAHHGSEECPFPVGVKLDTTYRQQAFSHPCSGGGAQTPLTLDDIPQSVHIECDGGYYWAVIPPIRLLALQFDNNGTVIQWGVHINDLYCGPGGAPNGGCNVKLDIYAKLK